MNVTLRMAVTPVEDPVADLSAARQTVLATIDEQLLRLSSPFSGKRKERRAVIRQEIDALLDRAVESLRREREATQAGSLPSGAEGDATAQIERSISLASALAKASMANARIYAEQRTQQEATSTIASAAQELVASVGSIAEQSQGVASDVDDAEARANRGRESSSFAFEEMRRLGSALMKFFERRSAV